MSFHSSSLYWIVIVLVFVSFTSATSNSTEELYDPCCSFPCQNQGVCMSIKGNKDFSCDCTGLEYYGQTCEIPYVSRRIKNWLRPSLASMHKLYTGVPWLWKLVNNVPFLQKAAMRYLYLSRGDSVDTPVPYNSGHEYITTESHFNTSYYARTLPPVPLNCPTPMGVAGKKELPDIDLLAERFFRRKEFIPEPHGTNLLFSYYAQHYNHQFFRTDKSRGPGFTLGNDGVDVSHIYGLDKATQDTLRSFRHGKMRVRILNGEEFPPLLRDVPSVHMIYPPHVPEEERVALGHPFFTIQPGLYVMSTIWIREHNRICDVLRAEHPHWDDERLYQTAKLIILGQNLKITIEEYVQHLSQYKIKLTYDPELLRDRQPFQFSNRIHVEFNHLYHWHPMAPDAFQLGNESYPIDRMSFSIRTVMDHGLDAFVQAMASQPAGALTHKNHGTAVLDTFKLVMRQGRELRLQSFNNYRLKFGMPKYSSFTELTGDPVLSKELEEIYGHIDALEFYPGLLLEKSEGSVTPFTMVNIGGPYAIKGMMANPISSPAYWKPSTFGGDVGFNIVKTATIRGLFCRNMKSPCGHIDFKLPAEESWATLEPSLDSPSPATVASSSSVRNARQSSPPAGMTVVSGTYRPDCHQADIVIKPTISNHCSLSELESSHLGT